MTNPITFALPSKGAIAEPTLNFLKDCGLRIDKPNQRQYTGVVSTIPSITVLFQRATDVLYKVADGTAQIGITGLDIVHEHMDDNLVIVHDKLGYGHCSLVVAVPETWVDAESMTDLLDISLDFREQKRRNLRIATKYPVLSRQFLHNRGIYHFTLVKAEGAIEAAPILGYADIIIDLTQTGTTLRENHLKIIPDGIILESQACLIGNRTSLRGNNDYLEVVRILTEYIDAAQQGRRYYQLIANIKGKSAGDIATSVAMNPVTRGLQGPTVSPILGIGHHDDQWFTVTVIIPNSDLLPAVEYIRSIGGTQIITSPVRYVFMENAPTFKRLLGNLS